MPKQEGYEITRIFLHCAATRPQWMENYPLERQVTEIRSWHLLKGWKDIGYHYIIGRQGRIAQGRPESQIGAHVKGQNRGSIGICLIGGHGSNSDDEATDHFTATQLDAARGLIEGLMRTYPKAKLHGHNEFAARACPGFDASLWWAGRPKPRPTRTWEWWSTLKGMFA